MNNNPSQEIIPEIVEKKGPTPNGGNRALGVFVDFNNKPTKKALAKYFIIKEFKGDSPICSSLFSIAKDGKLKFMKTVKLIKK